MEDARREHPSQSNPWRHGERHARRSLREMAGSSGDESGHGSGDRRGDQNRGISESKGEDADPDVRGLSKERASVEDLRRRSIRL